MSTPNRKQLAGQLERARQNGVAALLLAAARSHGLDPAYLLAIGSRESNLTNELGDQRGGEYHGVGILQIDVQHTIAEKARDTGSWKTDPGPLIQYGANLLEGNVAAARAHFPSLTADQHLKIAASGYNSGLVRAIDAAHQGDSDKYTTGHDYGADVMQRTRLFRELLAG